MYGATTPQRDAPRLTGLVLCRVGAHRLAFVARDVTAIDVPRAETLWAGRLFGAEGAPAEGARQVWHEAVGLVVDSLEVFAEPVPIFAVPLALRVVLGGALAGFVEAAGALWPVVSLGALGTHLAGARA